MLLVKNIAKIVGVDESGRLRVKGRDMNVLGEIDNAWLLADGDRIAAYGTMDKMPDRKSTRLNSSHQPQSRMPSSA